MNKTNVALVVVGCQSTSEPQAEAHVSVCARALPGGHTSMRVNSSGLVRNLRRMCKKPHVFLFRQILMNSLEKPLLFLTI